PDTLPGALGISFPAGMGTIPSLRLRAAADDLSDATLLLRSLSEIGKNTKTKKSPPFSSAARREHESRQSRTPIEVAQQLAKRYGHSLKTVQYIPAVAVIGRIRLSELTNDPSHRQDAEKLLEPYVSGKQKAISDKPS